jgi:hypothetical protein
LVEPDIGKPPASALKAVERHARKSNHILSNCSFWSVSVFIRVCIPFALWSAFFKHCKQGLWNRFSSLTNTGHGQSNDSSLHLAPLLCNPLFGRTTNLLSCLMVCRARPKAHKPRLPSPQSLSRAGPLGQALAGFGLGSRYQKPEARPLSPGLAWSGCDTEASQCSSPRFSRNCDSVDTAKVMSRRVVMAACMRPPVEAISIGCALVLASL